MRYSVLLRRELSARNREFARQHGLRITLSYGEDPVVVYEPDGEEHGNFLAASYAAILEHPAWRARLVQPHTSARTALPARQDGRWRELDSSNSSDALLMNVLCHPQTLGDPRVWLLLGEEPGSAPEFGYKARVPLAGGKFDRTEVDMRLGNLLVEAKLTEPDFQRCPCTALAAYRDYAEVFDRRRLPRFRGRQEAYQLNNSAPRASTMKETLSHTMNSEGCVCCWSKMTRQSRSFSRGPWARRDTRVDAAGDAATAESLASEGIHDAMIVDLGLPDLDGFDLIARCRAQGSAAPVLSARRSVDDRVRGLEQGGDDYLTKPFAFAELLARLRDLLRRAGSGQSESVRLRVADLQSTGCAAKPAAATNCCN